MSNEIENHVNIDHFCTDEIVCPHCGFEHGDSWENGLRHDGPQEHSGTEQCQECEKQFRWEREITASYCTTIPASTTGATGGGEDTTPRLCECSDPDCLKGQGAANLGGA